MSNEIDAFQPIAVKQERSQVGTNRASSVCAVS